MTINIIYQSEHAKPHYQTRGSAGVDLTANLLQAIIIKPMERALIKTGLFLELPQGIEAQVRPRSGLALKHGITVLNSPGTIDSDYRGEVGVILVNLSQEPFTVQNGDRIAQLVFAKYEQVKLHVVEELEETQRGAGGFGHTGKS